uniref:NB-ARC domain-containing protein n=1 Tax=Leersia perrieri TaxID=77586 RepID=A0A0D9WES5_9ORYZ
METKKFDWSYETSHYCTDAPYHLSGMEDILISLRELRCIKCISTLSNLEHLDLSGNLYLSNLTECVGNLKKLRTLDLSNCFHLKNLPESLSEINCLKSLNVTGCRELESVISRSQIHQNLVLLPNFVVQAGDRELGSNIFLLQDVNPVELQISCLENVQSAGEVKRIKLLQKTSISKLTLDWTRHAKRFTNDMNILGELMPPINFRQFELRGYSYVHLPGWLTCISSYLPNLVQIVMDEIPSCGNLPPLGQLQNLKELTLRRMPRISIIDGDLCGGGRAFPQLIKFTLDSMESLEEWRTSYEDHGHKFTRIGHIALPQVKVEAMGTYLQWKISNSDNVVRSCGEGQYSSASSSSSTTTLDVEHCKVPLDHWRLLCHLPALHELRIYECDNLTCSSPEIIQSLSSLKLMTVESQGMEELPAGLCELKSLPTLILWKCLKLKSLPQSMKHLTSLQPLWLVSCASMTLLPECLGNLTSLLELNINNCPHLKFLPESIQVLPMLEVVKISDCPELKRWCEIGENKMKLAHIRKKPFALVI